MLHETENALPHADQGQSLKTKGSPTCDTSKRLPLKDIFNSSSNPKSPSKAKQMATPSKFEAIRTLDDDESWKERTEVITKFEHVQYRLYAREMVDHIVDKLTVTSSLDQGTSKPAASHIMKFQESSARLLDDSGSLDEGLSSPGLGTSLNTLTAPVANSTLLTVADSSPAAPNKSDGVLEMSLLSNFENMNIKDIEEEGEEDVFHDASADFLETSPAVPETKEEEIAEEQFFDPLDILASFIEKVSMNDSSGVEPSLREKASDVRSSVGDKVEDTSLSEINQNETCLSNDFDFKDAHINHREDIDSTLITDVTSDPVDKKCVGEPVVVKEENVSDLCQKKDDDHNETMAAPNKVTSPKRKYDEAFADGKDDIDSAVSEECDVASSQLKEEEHEGIIIPHKGYNLDFLEGVDNPEDLDPFASKSDVMNTPQKEASEVQRQQNEIEDNGSEGTFSERVRDNKEGQSVKRENFEKLEEDDLVLRSACLEKVTAANVDEIELPKRDYHLDISDMLDDPNVNPFQTKSHVTNSPPVKSTHDLQTKPNSSALNLESQATEIQKNSCEVHILEQPMTEITGTDPKIDQVGVKTNSKKESLTEKNIRKLEDGESQEKVHENITNPMKDTHCKFDDLDFNPFETKSSIVNSPLIKATVTEGTGVAIEEYSLKTDQEHPLEDKEINSGEDKTQLKEKTNSEHCDALGTGVGKELERNIALPPAKGYNLDILKKLDDSTINQPDAHGKFDAIDFNPFETKSSVVNSPLKDATATEGIDLSSEKYPSKLDQQCSQNNAGKIETELKEKTNSDPCDTKDMGACIKPECEIALPPVKGYNLDTLVKLDDPNINPFITRSSVSNSPKKDIPLTSQIKTVIDEKDLVEQNCFVSSEEKLESGDELRNQVNDSHFAKKGLLPVDDQSKDTDSEVHILEQPMTEITGTDPKIGQVGVKTNSKKESLTEKNIRKLEDGESQEKVHENITIPLKDTHCKFDDLDFNPFETKSSVVNSPLKKVTVTEGTGLAIEEYSLKTDQEHHQEDKEINSGEDKTQLKEKTNSDHCDALGTGVDKELERNIALPPAKGYNLDFLKKLDDSTINQPDAHGKFDAIDFNPFETKSSVVNSPLKDATATEGIDIPSEKYPSKPDQECSQNNAGKIETELKEKTNSDPCDAKDTGACIKPECEIALPPVKGYNLDTLEKLDEPNINPFITRSSVSNSPKKDIPLTSQVKTVTDEKDLVEQNCIVSSEEKLETGDELRNQVNDSHFAKKGLLTVDDQSKNTDSEVHILEQPMTEITGTDPKIDHVGVKTNSKKESLTEKNIRKLEDGESQEKVHDNITIPLKDTHCKFDDLDFNPFETKSSIVNSPLKKATVTEGTGLAIEEYSLKTDQEHLKEKTNSDHCDALGTGVGKELERNIALPPAKGYNLDILKKLDDSTINQPDAHGKFDAIDFNPFETKSSVVNCPLKDATATEGIDIPSEKYPSKPDQECSQYNAGKIETELKEKTNSDPCDAKDTGACNKPEREIALPPVKRYNLDTLVKLDDPNINPFITRSSVSNSPKKDIPLTSQVKTVTDENDIVEQNSFVSSEEKLGSGDELRNQVNHSHYTRKGLLPVDDHSKDTDMRKINFNTGDEFEILDHLSDPDFNPFAAKTSLVNSPVNNVDLRSKGISAVSKSIGEAICEKESDSMNQMNSTVSKVSKDALEAVSLCSSENFDVLSQEALKLVADVTPKRFAGDTKRLEVLFQQGRQKDVFSPFHKDEFEQFVDATDFFNNPEDLDVLSTHGTDGDKLNLVRNSLYVKFDPLVSGRPSLAPYLARQNLAVALEDDDARRVSGLMSFSPSPDKNKRDAKLNGKATPVRPLFKTQANETITADETTLLNDTLSDGAQNLTVVTSAAGKELNTTVISHGGKFPSDNFVIEPPVNEEQNMVPVHVMNEKMRNLELVMQDKLLRQSRDLEDLQKTLQQQSAESAIVLGSLEEENSRLNANIEKLQSMMRKIVEHQNRKDKEYREKLILLEHDYDVKCQAMKEECQQQKQELKNVEAHAFDLVNKYTRLQEATSILKRNEETLKNENEALLEKISQKQDTFKNVLQNLEDKYAKEQQAYQADREKSKQEISKASLMLKKAEVKMLTLNDSVEKTTNENRRLQALIDEIGNS
ncbi:hypothetical protein SK128_008988 [Halocaridina rubra]|uniref:Transforming acidic coiled-coil-containing protein C-terminal domain-containing protein n=1 Tax=Halocaridina rubra TaxID=373956 RepID=A0AAN8ZWG7_HALRR